MTSGSSHSAASCRIRDISRSTRVDAIRVPARLSGSHRHRRYIDLPWVRPRDRPRPQAVSDSIVIIVIVNERRDQLLLTVAARLHIRIVHVAAVVGHPSLVVRRGALLWGKIGLRGK